MEKYGGVPEFDSQEEDEGENSALIVLAKVYEDHNLAARPARFMLELSEEEKEAMGFER